MPFIAYLSAHIMLSGSGGVVHIRTSHGTADKRAYDFELFFFIDNFTHPRASDSLRRPL